MALNLKTKLTTKEKETLVGLSLTGPLEDWLKDRGIAEEEIPDYKYDLEEYLASICGSLADAYRHGDKYTAKDSKLSEKYKALQSKYLKDHNKIHENQIDDNDKNLDGEIVSDNAPLLVAAPAPQPKKSSLSNFFSTETIYKTLGWFTSIRLLLPVRAQRVYNKAASLGWLPQEWPKEFVPKEIGAFLSLSYLLELFADSIIVLKQTFRPAETPEQKEMPTFRRWAIQFYQASRKGERPYRVANAAAWGAVNVALFFLTAGVSGYVNLALFVFDCLLEITRATHEQINIALERKKYKKEHAEKVKERNQLKSERNKLLSDPQKQHQVQEIEAQLAQLDKDINIAKYMRVSLKKRAKEAFFGVDLASFVFKSKFYPIIMTVGIVVGMSLLVAFPPVTVPAFIGAAVALGFGSLAFGCGRRIGRMIYDSYQERKAQKDRAMADGKAHEKAKRQTTIAPALKPTQPIPVQQPRPSTPPQTIKSSTATFASSMPQSPRKSPQPTPPAPPAAFRPVNSSLSTLSLMSHLSHSPNTGDQAIPSTASKQTIISTATQRFTQ